MANSRTRTTVVLALAALVPFAAIYGASTLAAKWNPPKPSAVTVEKFSDYFTEPKPALKTLAAAKEIWAGVTGERQAWFNDLAFVGGTVVVVGNSKLVAIRPHTAGGGAIEIPLTENLQRPSFAQAAGADGLWLYYFQSGRFTHLKLTEAIQPVRTVMLERHLLQPAWVGDRIVANGLFVDELWREYQVTSPAANSEGLQSFTTRVRNGHGALFPGITPQFARALNETVMDARPDGAKLALAFKWSDRINVYDTATAILERSIAGPVETKLSFAVDDFAGKPVFTLGPEAIYSYTDLVAADDYFVALYSGRERRKFGLAMASGVALHVFDWDGRLKGEWQLPEPIDQIALDTSTATLYGLRWKPHPSVVTVALDNVLPAPRPAHRAARRASGRADAQ